MIQIRHAIPDDRAAWLQMRGELWPEGDAAEHAAEIDRFLAGRLHEPLAVLIALAEGGDAVGFAELSIRRYAEDCVTDRVAYLEGWYVVPGARRQGVGRALVEAAFGWAVERGCIEFASDALIDNDTSAAAHRALGFEDVEQIRCFKRMLDDRRWSGPTAPLVATIRRTVIRGAVISDAEGLAQLVSELGYPTAPDQMHTRLEAILGDPAYSTFVALVDGRLAGFIGLVVRPSYEADGLYGQIMALVVASTHRRHGIGQQLVACVERLLVRRGVHIVIVNTANHRADAHAFYEKNCYVFTGRRYRKSLM